MILVLVDCVYVCKGILDYLLGVSNVNGNGRVHSGLNISSLDETFRQDSLTESQLSTV